MNKIDLKLKNIIHGCILWLLLPGIVSAATLDSEQLKTKVLAVSIQEGDAYTQGRKELEALYPDNKAIFNLLIQKAEDWRVGLLCEIVKERVAKREDVEAMINATIKMPDDHSSNVRTEKMGHLIAQKATNASMLLVEKIWKGNELKNWAGRPSDSCASVIGAVGDLKIRNARPMLEYIIGNDAYFSNRVEIVKSSIRPEVSIQRIRIYAVEALGKLGDPRSVSVLTTLMKKTADNPEDYSSWHAYQALIKCADKNSVEFLKKEGDESHSELFKKAITDTISAIEKRSKAEK